MFRHVVMFRWNDDVDDAHVDKVSAALTELGASLPEVQAYRHGRDAGLGADNFDYVVVADFDSPSDYETYRDHPSHQSLIEEHIAGRVAARAAVQYRTD